MKHLEFSKSVTKRSVKILLTPKIWTYFRELARIKKKSLWEMNEKIVFGDVVKFT